MDSEKKVLQVYRAINQVQAELAECGITKDTTSVELMMSTTY